MRIATARPAPQAARLTLTPSYQGCCSAQPAVAGSLRGFLSSFAPAPLCGSMHIVLTPCWAVQVSNFPFPTAPSAAALRAAQQCLVAVGALHPQAHPTAPLGLTALGREMARFPVGPRHARMLLQVALAANWLTGSASEHICTA